MSASIRCFPTCCIFRTTDRSEGKVFPAQLERAGGLFRSNREVAADINQRDECRECPVLDECYKFSMAKRALASAIITD